MFNSCKNPAAFYMTSPLKRSNWSKAVSARAVNREIWRHFNFFQNRSRNFPRGCREIFERAVRFAPISRRGFLAVRFSTQPWYKFVRAVFRQTCRETLSFHTDGVASQQQTTTTTNNDNKQRQQTPTTNNNNNQQQSTILDHNNNNQPRTATTLGTRRFNETWQRRLQLRRP